ncbi:MAG: hypothetical protein WKF84_17790 [Pyrinomonadaceae bacterium]
MKRVPKIHINMPIRHRRDERATRLLALLVAGGLMLATGFIYAAQQHFSAVRLGYLSEEMRRERARLIESQSRLMVAREQAASPARLELSARSIGMKPALSNQIDTQQQQEEKGSAQAKDAPHLMRAIAVSTNRLGAR